MTNDGTAALVGSDESTAQKIAAGDTFIRERVAYYLEDRSPDIVAIAQAILARADYLTSLRPPPPPAPPLGAPNTVLFVEPDFEVITPDGETYRVEEQDGFECPECGHVALETAEVRLYECGECGDTFAGHEGNRCQQCNKFAAKIADDCCVDCEAAEVNPATVIECPLCQEVVASDGAVAHLTDCGR